jgi:hypothetical protein
LDRLSGKSVATAFHLLKRKGQQVPDKLVLPHSFAIRKVFNTVDERWGNQIGFADIGATRDYLRLRL